MAAYAATVAISNAQPERTGRRFGQIMGTVNVTNYNSTLVELTDITKNFIDSGAVDIVVLSDGVSDSGFQFSWDSTSKSFKAWYSDLSEATDGPLIEVVDDTDVGQVSFVAFGITQ